MSKAKATATTTWQLSKTPDSAPSQNCRSRSASSLRTPSGTPTSVPQTTTMFESWPHGLLTKLLPRSFPTCRAASRSKTSPACRSSSTSPPCATQSPKKASIQVSSTQSSTQTSSLTTPCRSITSHPKALSHATSTSNSNETSSVTSC